MHIPRCNIDYNVNLLIMIINLIKNISLVISTIHKIELIVMINPRCNLLVQSQQYNNRNTTSAQSKQIG